MNNQVVLRHLDFAPVFLDHRPVNPVVDPIPVAGHELIQRLSASGDGQQLLLLEILVSAAGVVAIEQGQLLADRPADDGAGLRVNLGHV